MYEQKKILMEAQRDYTFNLPKFPQYVATNLLLSDYTEGTFWATDDIWNPRIFEYVGKRGMYMCFREVAVKKVGNYFGPVKKKYLDSNEHELQGTVSYDGVKTWDDKARDWIYLRPLIRYRKIDGKEPLKSFPKWKRGALVDFIDGNLRISDTFKITSRIANVVTMKRIGDNQLAILEIQPNWGEGEVEWPYGGVVKRGYLRGHISKGMLDAMEDAEKERKQKMKSRY